MSEKAKVFVIMPFSDEFFESYEMLKRTFEQNFEFSHAGDEENQQNILADIIPPIYKADIVIADLTGLNPNVMYELGIAHSFNKKTIVITRDEIGQLPFDLKQYRAKDYSTHFKKFNELIQYLEKNLNGVLDGSVIFSNPVADFLDKNKLNPQNLFSRESININIEESEKGFIDFLADIEEDAEKMTETINGMNYDMQVMSSGMEECTKEIDRVKKTGGSGMAAFVRKQSKKVAEYIETFSKQLKRRTKDNASLWEKIEKNTLGLLENKYAAENKDALVNYLKSLREMQVAIRTSNESIKTMKQTAINNIGIQRNLNQSIRFLGEDLATYLTMTEQMDASISRILDKSKFVVGEIELL
jgi:hypothetical protein